jgi:transposase
MAKDTERELAFSIYMTDPNITQESLSKRVKVTVATINKWINEGRWSELKAANTITRKNQIALLLMQLNELNMEIQKREAGKRFATAREADAMIKLGKAIKLIDKSITLSDYITAFKEFGDFLERFSPELAKQLIDYQNEFVQNKARELQS